MAYGDKALKVYSLAYGGTALEVGNISSSGGGCIEVNSNSTVVGKYSYGLRINHNSDWFAMYLANKGKTSPMIEFARTSATFGDLLRAKNENNKLIFSISGDGKRIYLTDVTSGEIKAIQVNNGVLEVVA